MRSGTDRGGVAGRLTRETAAISCAGWLQEARLAVAKVHRGMTMKRARWPKRWYKQIVALVIVSVLYWATRLPVVSARARVALVARFQFQRMTLPRVAGYEM